MISISGKINGVWKEFTVIYTLFFLMGAEMYLISPIIPLISSVFNVTVDKAGLLVVAYVLVYALMGPIIANRLVNVSSKKLIIFGMLIFSIGNFSCYISNNFDYLLLSRAVTGLGGAIAAPASWEYIAMRCDLNNKGKAVSIGAGVYALGQIIGVPLGSFLVSRFDWHVPFLVIAFMLFLVIIPSFLLLYNNKKEGIRLKLWTVWKEKIISLCFLATFFGQAARLGTYSYVGQWFADKYNFSLSKLGFLGLMSGVATMFGAFVTGLLINICTKDKKSIHYIGIISILCMGFSIVLVFYTNILYLAIFMLLFWCLAGAVFQAYMQTRLASLSSGNRPSAIAWNNSLLHGGIAFGTFLLGLLWGQVWFVLTVILLASLACIFCNALRFMDN